MCHRKTILSSFIIAMLRPEVYFFPLPPPVLCSCFCRIHEVGKYDYCIVCTACQMVFVTLAKHIQMTTHMPLELLSSGEGRNYNCSLGLSLSTVVHILVSVDPLSPSLLGCQNELLWWLCEWMSWFGFVDTRVVSMHWDPDELAQWAECFLLLFSIRSYSSQSDTLEQS